ncbi:hypothetical protein HC864_00205 [Candidatus Gracilibacteria bacterium]|nr:hypothetical protein [Candidatus Gracilibacteria bacterium]
MIEKLVNKLEIDNQAINILLAGFPTYPRNFSRDSFCSLFLLEDTELLKNQIIYSSYLQGQKFDNYTGEEIGKVHHEYPGVELNGKNTQYNACDTTALYLIAHLKYQELTEDCSLAQKYQKNIHLAVEYIIDHINDEGLFIEKQADCVQNCFAVSVTYWKDSVLSKRAKDDHFFPVFYYLAHCMNLAAIRAASKILNTSQYQDIENKMLEGLHYLFQTHSHFPVAFDQQGLISMESSDFIHSLYYLQNGDLTSVELDWISDQAQKIATGFGYLVNPKYLCNPKHSYHSCTLWPFEQAFIYIGAKKFQLNDIVNVAKRIYNKTHTYPEIIYVDNQTFDEGGNNPQLWTFACFEYFKKELELDK